MTLPNPTSLATVFSVQGVGAAFFSTTLLRQRLAKMPGIFSSLDLLLAGGETMRQADAFKALSLVRNTFAHVYGPTENTTFSTIYRMESLEKCVNGVPIGRAIHNSGALILDSQQRPVPLGLEPLSQVSPLPIQYRDFATWQRQADQLSEHENQLEY